MITFEQNIEQINIVFMQEDSKIDFIQDESINVVFQQAMAVDGKDGILDESVTIDGGIIF